MDCIHYWKQQSKRNVGRRIDLALFIGDRIILEKFDCQALIQYARGISLRTVGRHAAKAVVKGAGKEKVNGRYGKGRKGEQLTQLPVPHHGMIQVPQLQVTLGGIGANRHQHMKNRFGTCDGFSLNEAKGFFVTVTRLYQ